MKAKMKILLMVLVACAALFGTYLAVAGGSSAPPQPGAQGAAAGAGEARSSASIHDVDQWVAHLAEGGTVRVKPSNLVDNGIAERVIVGQGRVDAPEKKRIDDLLLRMVSKADRKLKAFYARASSGDSDSARWQFREAELILRAREEEAFQRAFRDGSYILINSTQDAPPIPPGVIALNVGVTHKGRSILAKILVRDEDHGLDEVRTFKSGRRSAWLTEHSFAFNSRQLAERERMIRRYIKNAAPDKSWRRKHFPAGLGVDLVRKLTFVE